VTLTPWQENLITRQFADTRHRPAVPLPPSKEADRHA
jgi:hypothetical protein